VEKTGSVPWYRRAEANTDNPLSEWTGSSILNSQFSICGEGGG
jgi:hypothetical protein